MSETSSGFRAVDDVSEIFHWAEDELKEIDRKGKAEKKAVILELVKRLDGKFQENEIGIMIKRRLARLVSARYIDQCLESRYKQPHRVNNARKRRPEPNPAEQALLNSNVLNSPVASPSGTQQLLLTCPPEPEQDDDKALRSPSGRVNYPRSPRIPKALAQQVSSALQRCDEVCYINFDSENLMVSIEPDSTCKKSALERTE